MPRGNLKNFGTKIAPPFLPKPPVKQKKKGR